MCRLVAYKGASIPLGQLIFDPPHSLEVQSYDPQELLSGTVNVDGFGCGWYNPDLSRAPGVYSSLDTLWSDAGFRSISRVIESSMIFGALRSATPPSPVDPQSVMPFTRGRYLFMHNGFFKPYHEKVKRRLQARIPEDLFSTLHSHSDSAALFAVLYDFLRKGEPSLENLVSSLIQLMDVGRSLAAEADVEFQANILVSDGDRIAGVRASNTEESNSLYYLQNGEVFPDALVIASERLNDESRWERVPHNSIIRVDARNRINIQPLTTGE